MSGDEDLEISNRTWDRNAASVIKGAYREGASDGHDAAFQKGFDLGYLTGFRNAEKIGLITGALRAFKELEMSKGNDDSSNNLEGLEFDNAQRGFCIMCPTSSETEGNLFSKQSIASSAAKFDNTNINEILERQSEHLASKLNKKVQQYNTIFGQINLKFDPGTGDIVSL